MMDISLLTSIGIYLLLILIPTLILYIIYLIITRAFKDMGFTSIEAIIIVFASLLLGGRFFPEIIINNYNISNIYLFTHNNWLLQINTGGAIIPIILSIYLLLKNKISIKKIFISILFVAIIAFIVTRVDPTKGIVSSAPYWLLPVFGASLSSIILLWKDKPKAAPMAYISGTIGVLIGADFFHLPELLSYTIQSTQPASIGGANVFDMIFITGILAVIVDGMIMFGQKHKKQTQD